ncbi:cell wall hydrolase [Natroniella sulfidigena]|uniref:cell wall hydrolase n=1 Tax=Natroniella sulfidigena TaxID=723921 RepID=UPI00200A88CC|nr:cell wall hydrolase [Natroniella sulfidigena]MCK8816474.1 cell wall hydrolase [Natroniella sulfidigena]
MFKKNKLIVGLAILFILFTAEISWAAPNFRVKLVYTVGEGEALINIARQFEVSVREIRELNSLEEDEFIRAGDKLLIPEHHEVVDGIAIQEDINKLYQPDDELDNYQLDVNQEYKVKVRKESPRQEIDVSDLETLDYPIKRGDNLYDLAREFNTNVSVLRELNDLGSSDVIRLGDTIQLPINNLSDKEVLYHTVSDEEVELLARIIHGEARGEPYIGQVAVGAVVLNRVIDSYFPDDIEAVIYQSGQFSPVFDGQINLTPNRTAYRAAEAALRGEDPTRGAVYFYNPRTANYISWFETRDTIVKIGNHVFAR